MARINQKIKLSLLLAFVTSSRGAPVTYEYNYAPTHEYAPKDYSFSYGVKDLHTGDVKHQWEKKEGEHIRGHYSLIEPDGSVRIVDYSADDKTGFNARVKHQGSHYHPLSPKATSHNEFLLKESDFPAQDYAVEKLESPKSAIITQDYEHYTDKNYGLTEEAKNEDETPEYTYVYAPQEDEAYQASAEEVDDHEAEGSKTTVKFTTKDVKQPKLPVDLDLLKPNSKGKLIPLDVSLLNPIEIDLSSNSYKNLNATSNLNTLVPHQNNANVTYDVTSPLSEEDYHTFLKEYYGSEDKKNFRPLQLSSEEYQKFLKEYYANTNGNNFKRPYQDSDFRPTVPNNISLSSPNTFRTNKRPVTTPGLRNYSTGHLYQTRLRIPKLNYSGYLHHNKIGPVAFSDKRRSQGISRLYRNIGNKYVRYAKRTTTYVRK